MFNVNPYKRSNLREINEFYRKIILSPSDDKVSPHTEWRKWFLCLPIYMIENEVAATGI